MLETMELKELMPPLLEWFTAHARVLPWRELPTPYRVWVSEIMLQQTRVEAVKPYFERFTSALPDVFALAACPEDELLKLWEGLGYYNRVRNLQKAAVQVVEEYGGVIPAEYDELLKLKGIGHYTAGAVASIAYGRYVPAVDGNVLRILTRVTADDTDIMKQSFRTAVERALLAMMQELKIPDGLKPVDGNVLRILTRVTADDTDIMKQSFRTAVERALLAMMQELKIPDGLKRRLRDGNIPGALNQALMELGATVCVPNGAPFCGECPWENFCLAKKEGCIGELPVKSKAKARKIEARTVLILRDGDKVAIRKRPDRGLLAGLYELPNVEGRLSQEEVLGLVKEMGLEPVRIQRLSSAKHIFSHIEWHMDGYAVLLEGGLPQKGEHQQPFIFVEAEDAKERYAIPSAFAAYAGYMNILLGNERFEGEQ